MRITIVTVARSWGGMEVHTIYLARALAERGHVVTLVPLGTGVYETHESARGTPFRIAPVEFTADPEKLPFREWRDLLSPFSGDVCVFARNGLAQGGLGFNLAVRRSHARLLYMEHVAPSRTTEEKRPREGWRRWFPRVGWWHLRMSAAGERRLGGVEAVVSVSEEGQRALWSELRFPLRKLVTVRNGIDTDLFRPDDEARREVRRGWGVPPDAIVCGAVARFDNESKRLDLLLRAFAAASAARPELPLRCVLVGDGPDRSSLCELAESLGVGDRVHLAPFAPQPWRVFPGLDIFLITSRFEALPLSLLEAMASECYPIGVRVGGITEVLDARGVGDLVGGDDEQGLASALAAAAALSTEERAVVGRRARERVVSGFQARHSYANLVRLIEASS